ncbi:MAG: enoyl-CoA hydratase-related protein [Gammaproteobacteria bacterium]|nr:enoyl-CoA hydratase-related protein [Gammaproteobacteria bacterium]
MNYEFLKVDVDQHGICTLMLNRPDVRNALNDRVVTELRDAVKKIGANDSIRVLVLTGAGSAFCAGGDFRWMTAMKQQTREERVAGGLELAHLFVDLEQLTMPIVGRINGDAFGGGTGLTSICDYAFGSRNGKMSVSEVRIGLVPANIAPYLVRRMGLRNAKATMLNGVPLEMDEAVAVGLLNEAVNPEELDDAVENQIAKYLRASPVAIAATKKLIEFVSKTPWDQTQDYTANCIADAWETEDAIEGMNAFFEKRKANWWIER